VAGPGIWICNECIDLAAGAVGARASQTDGRASFDLADHGAGARCAFCGKRRRDVDQLAVSPAGAICDQCLELCQEVLAEDRG
jgi:ATP-dependent protease Clp ATPase subunit